MYSDTHKIINTHQTLQHTQLPSFSQPLPHRENWVSSNPPMSAHQGAQLLTMYCHSPSSWLACHHSLPGLYKTLLPGCITSLTSTCENYPPESCLLINLSLSSFNLACSGLDHGGREEAYHQWVEIFLKETCDSRGSPG